MPVDIAENQIKGILEENINKFKQFMNKID